MSQRSDDSHSFFGTLELDCVECFLDLFFDSVGGSECDGSLEFALDSSDVFFGPGVVNLTNYGTVIVWEVIFF